MKDDDIGYDIFADTRYNAKDLEESVECLARDDHSQPGREKC